MNEIIVTPLGTISPYPKGDRNCPGFLVRYKDYKILLDCGSGISRLLTFPDDLINMSVIISHFHKDHYDDLGSIQYASYVYQKEGILKDPVNIYYPEIDAEGYNIPSITTTDIQYSKFNPIPKDGMSFDIDDLHIELKDNGSHIPETYMVKMQNSEHKIVYTADTGTNNFDELVEFCKDSDLLICESALLKIDNRLTDKHLTAYEAGRLAKLSNSKKMIITHLWPEQDRNLYLEEAKTIYDNVELAEEGNSITIR